MSKNPTTVVGYGHRETGVKNWIDRLIRSAKNGINTKVRKHVKNTLDLIQKLDENTMLRKH